jgi:FSR family fosmidomycin resistance protein-like MFS transporter
VSAFEPTLVVEPASAPPLARAGAATGILVAVAPSHMLNDMMQALAPALFPVFQQSYGLSFFQLGMITFAFQATSSLLQPAVGLYTDLKPRPWSLPAAMATTLCGLLLLASATSYPMLLVSVALIGVGSAIFHPEASRVARAASGGRFGFAQSLFQVGGNFGTSLGPLMAAYIVVPNGQKSVAVFGLLAVLGAMILSRVALWYRARPRVAAPPKGQASRAERRRIGRSLTVLIVLVFSKAFYMASISSYYTLYLIATFHVVVQEAQLCLFAFLAATAAGTFVGGPIGDHFGRKFVIWLSILGVAPFTLLLPYAGYHATILLSIGAGFVLASAFPAIVVYAQELVPGNVGAVSGLFFGLTFGLGGLGAAALGRLADLTSIGFVYQVCAYLPLLGLLTWFLPDLRRR